MNRTLLMLAVLSTLCWSCSKQPAPPSRLETESLAAVLDPGSGKLVELQSKLTGESYSISGDEFSLQAEEFTLDFPSAALESFSATSDSAQARYRAAAATVDVSYTLRKHFLEKRLVVYFNRGCRLKSVAVSRPSFSAPNLSIVPYRHLQSITYFGRTPQGGFFAGVELPFDSSSAAGNRITLAYTPSLKIKPNEALECEPVYFGVYRRGPADRDVPNLPLQSESDAMVAMTSEALGPPRHGLVPMACGWWSEMEHFAYDTDAKVEGDMRSLDFLAECGVDWVSDSHPWGGETEKMNNLVEGQKYEIGDRVRRFLEHAKKVDVKVVMWPTMNNTHPWWEAKMKPFRPDRPDWVQFPGGRKIEHDHGTRKHTVFSIGNCIANRPFLDWLTEINEQGLATGYYAAWAMDGDFVGGGGAIGPVDCPSDAHDHLPGDATYASERALDRLTAGVRKTHPRLFLTYARPPMDLGVWSNRYVDATFTIDEWADLTSLERLKDQPVNVAYGDKIRQWSRVRVHRHFFPHYLDQPQVFVAPESMKREGQAGRPWPSDKIDYIMLSALSSSPNQLYYLPTKQGIPGRDKAEIKKWLDWGRKNIEFLKVRKDLPDWPGAGRVDGSGHAIKTRGYVFLFNPNKQVLKGTFELTAESIGLEAKGKYRVQQAHPASQRVVAASHGDRIEWEVPGETAVIVQIAPDETSQAR